jgi:pimeloyl-ACP methyl ester carboxylesterase
MFDNPATADSTEQPFRRWFPFKLWSPPIRMLLVGCVLSNLIATRDSTALLGQEAGDAARKLVVRSVLPSATDSRIDKFSGDGWEHWVYFDPAATERHLLVVFLPGTGGKGNGAKAFCTLAAGEGFHVVSLAYPSDVSMSVFHASVDPDAFLKARENIIYGKLPFGKLDTGVPNSIENRLRQLLRYLAAKFPQEHWKQFLQTTGDLRYSKLVLAGQSQGGGHAALIAMQHEVARVLMFGAPKDFNVHFNKPAKWFSGPNATPLDRFFSFVHSLDEGPRLHVSPAARELPGAGADAEIRRHQCGRHVRALPPQPVAHQPASS